MTMKTRALTASLATALLLFLTMACTGDDEESGSTSPPSPSASADADGFGGGGGGEPDPAVVQVLQSLPVSPNAAPASLADGKYTYPPGGSESGRDLWTGFSVLPGTTVEDVTSFFAKHLPPDGWQEEAPPWTESAEKEGSASKTVIYTFLKADLRLHIQIPLTHKDAPDGVANVNLILAPKDIQLHGSPVGTPIDSTPPPTPSVITPTCAADQRPCYAPAPETH